MIHSLLSKGSSYSKMLVAAILFSFYSCGTPPANTENSKETDITEVQPIVNTGANTDQENRDYAEKQDATNQAIAMYEFRKNGLPNKTVALIDKDNYESFSEETWLALLKKEEETKGAIESYSMQTSKIENLADGGKIVKMTFAVTRNGKKYMEEMDFMKMNEADFYLLKEIEFEGEKSSTEDDD